MKIDDDTDEHHRIRRERARPQYGEPVSPDRVDQMIARSPLSSQSTFSQSNQPVADKRAGFSNYKGVQWTDDEAAARESRIAKLKEMLGR
jgi:hypothetical protein